MSMVKKNILYISAHLPSLNVPQAGHKIAFSILKSYSEKYNVYLVTFVNEKEINYLKRVDLSFCKEVSFVKINNKDRFLSIIRNPFLPLKVATRVNIIAKNIFRDIQRKIKFDVIHFEFTAAGYYHKYIKQNLYTVITEHDVTYQSIERKKINTKSIIKKLIYILEFKRQKKWELSILLAVDKINVLNQKDKDILVKDGIDSKKIIIVKPYIDPIFNNISRENVEKYSLLFWGAMNRKENVDAIKWFIKNIMPLIVKNFPETKLYVVGAKPSKKIINLKETNIIITGYVENPRKYFEKCQIAIAPLRLGAGIKIKVLEYLNAGIPVVSTSVGAEGINNDKLYITDDPIKFANKIKLLFKNIN